MKKQNLLIKSIITLLVLCGATACNTAGGNAKSDERTAILEALRKGFRISGTVDQQRQILTGRNGRPTGEIRESTFDVEYTYQNIDEVGFEAHIYDDKGFTVYENCVLENFDGYAYTYELGPDNKAHKLDLVDAYGNKVNYGYYCSNPFSMIIEDDLTKKDDNTYVLSKAKAAMFAGNVLTVVDEHFYEVMETAEITVENGVPTAMTLSPVDILSYSTDTETRENTYYNLSNVANFRFYEVGKAKIDVHKPREHQDHHDRLQEAFSRYADCNYTIKQEWSSYTNDVLDATNYYAFYCDGKSMYFQASYLADEPSSVDDVILYAENQGDPLTPLVYDPSSDKFSASAALKDYSALKGLYYEDVTPMISDVHAEIFDYDAANDKYTICKEMETYAGVLCLLPPLGVPQFLDGYGTSLDVYLTESGNIDKIVASYKADYLFYVTSGTITITFEEVGSTVLPFDVDNKLDL